MLVPRMAATRRLQCIALAMPVAHSKGRTTPSSFWRAELKREESQSQRIRESENQRKTESEESELLSRSLRSSPRHPAGTSAARPRLLHAIASSDGDGHPGDGEQLSCVYYPESRGRVQHQMHRDHHRYRPPRHRRARRSPTPARLDIFYFRAESSTVATLSLLLAARSL